MQKYADCIIGALGGQESSVELRRELAWEVPEKQQHIHQVHRTPAAGVSGGERCKEQSAKGTKEMVRVHPP